MIKAIHNGSFIAWYCDNCKKGNHNLYINTETGEKWQECCVPEDIKNKAEWFDHNGERIEKNEN